MKILNEIANENNRKTIIFVETKRRADEIARTVNRRGFNALAIHGDKSQSERDYTLNSFRSGRMNVQILIATDVASRGLGMYTCFRTPFVNRNKLLSVRISCGRDLSLFFFPIGSETFFWFQQFLFICRIFSPF